MSASKTFQDQTSRDDPGFVEDISNYQTMLYAICGARSLLACGCGDKRADLDSVVGSITNHHSPGEVSHRTSYKAVQRIILKRSLVMLQMGVFEKGMAS